MAKEVVMANLKNKFNLPQAIGRLNPLPVDADYVKDTYDLAASFATSDPTAYVGQLIYAKNTDKVDFDYNCQIFQTFARTRIEKRKDYYAVV